MKRVFVILIVTVVTVGSISAFGPFKMGGHGSVQYDKPVGMDISTLNIPDGKYQGSATGFKPDLQVEIVVEKGKLTSVIVTDHNEVGPKYYQTPINFIPQLIVKEQNTEVDSVSGATATSKAIMAAVEDAINSATNS